MWKLVNRPLTPADQVLEPIADELTSVFTDPYKCLITVLGDQHYQFSVYPELKGASSILFTVASFGSYPFTVGDRVCNDFQELEDAVKDYFEDPVSVTFLQAHGVLPES